jgi:hypothetical protein
MHVHSWSDLSMRGLWAQIEALSSQQWALWVLHLMHVAMGAGVDQIMRLSGLEPLSYVPNTTNMRETFLYIGERCNVAGSIIYKKAIVDGDYDKAAAIALKQV